MGITSRDHDDTFVAFVAGARRDLRRTAFLLCGDWHRAEDVTQDALLRLYAAWSRIERREGALGYTRRIVVRTLVDHSRRPWRRESPREDLSDTAVPSAEAAVDHRMLLMDALAALPPRRRACVVLRYFDELSVAETARALGCSEGTVKSQTARALDDLRNGLEAQGLVGYDVLEGASR